MKQNRTRITLGVLRRLYLEKNQILNSIEKVVLISTYITQEDNAILRFVFKNKKLF